MHTPEATETEARAATNGTSNAGNGTPSTPSESTGLTWRGLRWELLPGDWWQLRDRGDLWLIYQDAASGWWQVSRQRWGQPLERVWALGGVSRWPTPVAAADAVADALAAGVLGAGI